MDKSPAAAHATKKTRKADFPPSQPPGAPTKNARGEASGTMSILRPSQRTVFPSIPQSTTRRMTGHLRP
jgi:hypothetical protein